MKFAGFEGKGGGSEKGGGGGGLLVVLNQEVIQYQPHNVLVII